MQACLCSGSVSCCSGAWALGHVGSVAAAGGLSSCSRLWSAGSIAVVHRIRLCGMWDLPRLGVNPYPLHWLEGSYLLCHQVSPGVRLFISSIRYKKTSQKTWLNHHSGILQARIQEWVDFPFSRGSSWPRNPTGSPALQVDSLPTELSGKPNQY